MTVHELADLVRRMRDSQRRFDRESTHDALLEKAALQALVDQAVAGVLRPAGEGPGLFDEPR